jgi:hypothetical protein
MKSTKLNLLVFFLIFSFIACEDNPEDLSKVLQEAQAKLDALKNKPDSLQSAIDSLTLLLSKNEINKKIISSLNHIFEEENISQYWSHNYNNGLLNSSVYTDYSAGENLFNIEPRKYFKSATPYVNNLKNEYDNAVMYYLPKEEDQIKIGEISKYNVPIYTITEFKHSFTENILTKSTSNNIEINWLWESGKIKTVEVHNKKYNTTKSFKYNTNGILYSKKEVFNRNKVLDSTHYELNEQNLITKKTSYRYNEKPLPGFFTKMIIEKKCNILVTELFYNSNQLIDSIVNCTNNEIYNSKKFTYDSNHNLIEKTIYQLPTITKYNYQFREDESYKISIDFSPIPNIHRIESIEFDKLNRIISSSSDNGEMKYIAELIYGESNLIIEQKQQKFDKNDSLIELAHTKYKNSEIIEETRVNKFNNDSLYLIVDYDNNYIVNYYEYYANSYDTTILNNHFKYSGDKLNYLEFEIIENNSYTKSILEDIKDCPIPEADEHVYWQESEENIIDILDFSSLIGKSYTKEHIDSTYKMMMKFKLTKEHIESINKNRVTKFEQFSEDVITVSNEYSNFFNSHPYGASKRKSTILNVTPPIISNDSTTSNQEDYYFNQDIWN